MLSLATAALAFNAPLPMLQGAARAGEVAMSGRKPGQATVKNLHPCTIFSS